MRLRYTRAAQRDLSAIYEHIAANDPAAARRVEERIRASISLLVTWPRIGVLTDLEEVRRLPIVRYPYAVYYRVLADKEEVHVLRIIHAARIRDLGKLPQD